MTLHSIYRPAVSVALALCAAGLAQAAPASAPASAIDSAVASVQPTPKVNGARIYIVRLADEPAASYSGGIAGLAATRPANGQRLNVTAANVQAYTAYLGNKQASVAAAVGGVKTVQRYSAAFNGFSAVMTDAQAKQMQSVSGVVSITADSVRKLSTSYTPTFLGLDKPNGLWPQLGGKGAAGEGIIIGVLDTGVVPENPSFSDKVDASGAPVSRGGTLAYGPPPASWKGKCDVAPSFTTTACNNKLIGARSFSAGFEAVSPVDTTRDYLSPRDANSHGTHTLSTAGGNSGVVATLANGFMAGKVSGMAPRARLAMYKMCWYAQGSAGVSCMTSDAVAAIDQAVKDGVNIISYSISGSFYSIDPVDAAFLGANTAGVFVAAAGGNDGLQNVNHVAPWVTTVTASTHDRVFLAPLTLGNGAFYRGGSTNAVAVPSSPIVLAADVALPGANAANVAICNTNSLDPAKAAGKIVVCDRGLIALQAKADEAKRVQAAALIVTNVPGGLTEIVDFDVGLPWMNLGVESREAVRAYAAQPQAQASMGLPQATTGEAVAPQRASFASYGPHWYDQNVLKPDLAAPGVSILAGSAPALNRATHDAVANGSYTPPPTWALFDGTSMATPHVAGVAALVMQKNPKWSPAAIKSALMTSAYNLKPAPGGAALTPFFQGAGHIDPNKAADPGLVYDITAVEYQRYGCYVGLPCPAGLTPLITQELNQPAIVAATVLGKQTLTRRVTNVSNASSTYYGTASMAGFDVQISPAFLTLMPGETKSFNVTLSAQAATPQYQWRTGHLQWSDGVHVVRTPLVAQRQLVTSPPFLLNSGKQKGSALSTLGTGFTGPIQITTEKFDGPVFKTTAPWGRYRGASNCGLSDGFSASELPMYKQFTVPQGTSLMYLSGPREGDFPAGQDFWDIYIAINTANPNVGYFIFPGYFTRELPTAIYNPAPGNWVACNVGYAGDGSTDYSYAFALHMMFASKDANWTLKASGPSAATLGSTATVGISWNVPTQDDYYGSVSYLVNGSNIGSTQVWVRPGMQAAPAAQVQGLMQRGAPMIDLSKKSAQTTDPKLRQ